MNKGLVVAEHVKGYYACFAVDLSDKRDHKTHYVCPTTFESLCYEVKKFREEGYSPIKNWGDGPWDLGDVDSLGLLSPLTSEEMGELEKLTNPETPTVNELDRLFKLG